MAVLAPLLLVGSYVWAGCEFVDHLEGDLDDLPDAGLTPEHIPEDLELFDRYARSKGWSVPEEVPDRKHRFRVDSLFTIGMIARDDTVSVYGGSTSVWPDGHRRDPWQR